MQQTISVKKRILSLFMILLISFTLIISDYKRVEAVVGVDDVLLTLLSITIGTVVSIETSDDYQDWYDNELRPKWREVIREGLGVIGGKPIDPVYFDNKFPNLGPDLLQELRIIINKRSGTPIEDITDDMCKQFAYNAFSNCNFNEDNDTFYTSNDYNLILKHFDEVINANKGYHYAYSTPLQNYLNDINDGTQYNALRRLVDNNPDKVFSVYGITANALNTLYAFPYDGNYAYVNKFYSEQWNYNTINGFYDFESWQLYLYDVYTYSGGEYTVVSQEDLYGDRISFRIFEDIPKEGQNLVGALSNDTKQVIVFDSLNELKNYSRGVLPFYTNNTVYNTWDNSTGDYTVTTDNSNKASYGDITNYINSFNSENGYNPSPNDINVFIETYDPTITPTPTPNPNNPSGGGGSATATANNEGINVNVYNNHTINFGGGGSVSGNGTVSGNEIQDGGGVGNIFSFLSQIGDVLGSLIKNVGHVLAELVSGISETISALLEGIPTVFGDFMGALLGWLPEELRALITLGISAMIIVGVIKLFRG